MNVRPPAEEKARLKALKKHMILDSPPEAAFDRITGLGARLLRAPISLISFTDEKRDWIKSSHGFRSGEVAREESFSAHTICSDGLLVVLDALADPRFSGYAMVKGDPCVRFYAGAPIKTADGFRVGALCVMDSEPRSGLDATEASNLSDLAAVAARELELRRCFSSFFEAATEAVVTSDAGGRITSINARTEEMFGYTRDELLGQSLEMLVPDRLREDHSLHRKNFFARPHVLPMGIGRELSARRKDGSEFPVEISLNIIDAGSGPLALSFITDITERKRLEEQLLHAQRMEAVGRLAGGVAHDFNNLLTVIAGYNRLILDHLSPTHVLRGYAEEILKAGDRATALTDQLLAFSRRQVTQPKILDINPVIATLERMLRRLIGEHIELRTLLNPDVPRVKIGPGQIEQVVINLAVNARDAMPGGGRITVETGSVEVSEDRIRAPVGLRPGHYLVLSVRDTGCGMDAETKAHLFEPFFTTKEQGKGTGLGLSTVYGIVKQNGGDILVESEQGKGSAFTIFLPKAEEEAAGALTAAAAPGGAERGKETILLVEDQAEVRKLVREILVRQGYMVLEAGSGYDAISVCRQHNGPIHLLLTDVVMPGMGGREVAQQLASLLPRLRVLYMSGYPDNAITETAGSDDEVLFLQKPFTPDALKRKIREALS